MIDDAKLAHIIEKNEAKHWRRLDGQNQLPKVILGVRFTDGIEVAKRRSSNCRLTSLVTNIRS